MFLKTKNVIHRDLKLQNLLISSLMEIKICDFGLAVQLAHPEDRRKSLCGTPNYMAPEVINANLADGHSFEVDVWALGVIMYTLLIGKPPFETDHV